MFFQSIPITCIRTEGVVRNNAATKHNPYESPTHVKRGRRLLRACRRVTRAHADIAARETRLIINLTTSERRPSL